MLRIRFSMADIGRVVVSEAPMIEVAASIDALHSTPRSEFMQRWRRSALARVPPSARALIRLVGALGVTPPELIPTDCALPTGSPLWTVLRAYHAACLGDVWQRVQANKTEAVTAVTDNLVAYGVTAALDGLGPTIRWRGDVLEVDGLPDRQVDLAGRGLRVVPSVFWQAATFSEKSHDKPVLVFPVGAAPNVREEYTDPLVALLGRTRADVLRATVTGTGTGDIARRLGVSAASVSEHATALRRAGLLSTRRLGREVRHAPTPLGRQLLRTGGSAGPVSVPAEILSGYHSLGA